MKIKVTPQGELLPKGVHYFSSKSNNGRNYIAKIGQNKKNIYLGAFRTIEEANAAYKEAKNNPKNSKLLVNKRIKKIDRRLKCRQCLTKYFVPNWKSNKKRKLCSLGCSIEYNRTEAMRAKSSIRAKKQFSRLWNGKTRNFITA